MTPQDLAPKELLERNPGVDLGSIKDVRALLDRIEGLGLGNREGFSIEPALGGSIRRIGIWNSTIGSTSGN